MVTNLLFIPLLFTSGAMTHKVRDDGLNLGQALSTFQTITPRRRISGWFNSFYNGTSQYASNGTTDLSETGKATFYPFTTCTDNQWLFVNGSNVGATGLLTSIGNAISVKAGLLNNGNFRALGANSSLLASLTTPIITANNVQTTAISANSTTVAMPTANFPAGTACLDTTNSVTFTVSSVTSSSACVVYPAVTLGSGDTIEATSYPGNAFVIGDMQWILTNPIGDLLTGGVAYSILNYVQVGAGQKYPFSAYCGNYINFLGATGYRSSSIPYGTSTNNGADYTWQGNPTLGTTSGTGWQFAPSSGVCTQIVPAVVIGVGGDSISYGYANNNGGGYLGTALNAAGMNFVCSGVAGVTALNLSRFDWYGNWVSKAVDGFYIHVDTNDLPGGNSVAVIEAADISLATQKTAHGAWVRFCTMLPRGTTSDNLTTLAGQTPLATEGSRLLLNNWLRDTGASGFRQQAQAVCRGTVKDTIDETSKVETNVGGGLVSLNQTTYTLTVPSSSITYLTTYTTGAYTVTCGPTTSSSSTLTVTCPSASLPSTGTLSIGVGSGPSTLAYTVTYQSSANQQGFGTGGRYPLSNGGTTGGTAWWASADYIHPALTLNTALATAVPATADNVLNNNVFGG